MITNQSRIKETPYPDGAIIDAVRCANHSRQAYTRLGWWGRIWERCKAWRER